jgi:hypothetical protein
MPTPPDDPLRKVTLNGECHEYNGCLTNFGHGQFWYEGRHWNAHRYSWTRQKGPIPEGMSVLHTCDNPACIRIEHLFLGTQEDNMRDAQNKGRRYFPPKKLSEEQKQVIISRLLAGHTYQSIANDYSVSKQTIYRIANGFR